MNSRLCATASRQPAGFNRAARKFRRKMRRQAYTVIALLVLVGSMAVAAQAQTGSRTRLVANIPFEFTVGNKTLPAGEYQLRSIAGNSVNAVLLMQDRDCKAETLGQIETVI